jgi:hypothetical protein
MLRSLSSISKDHQMGKNTHIEYTTPFILSDLKEIASNFQFTRDDVRATYTPDDVHDQAYRKYQIYCDDFILVTGTVDNPEKILLINRAEAPLAGALWPLGGRAGNCASEDLRMAALWRSHPLQASLLLSIFRESNLQPSDLSYIGKLVSFHITFQTHNCPEGKLFNEDHPAVLHAVWIKPGAETKLNFKAAVINKDRWLTRDDILALEAENAILDHVSHAARAIFEHPHSIYYDNPLLATRLFP